MNIMVDLATLFAQIERQLLIRKPGCPFQVHYGIIFWQFLTEKDHCAQLNIAKC